MDTYAPFSLRYHNRDGGTAHAPMRRVPVGDGGDTVKKGDPMQVEAGVAADYIAGDGVFGVAVNLFPTYSASAGKDAPDLNHALIYPAGDEAIVYRVQARNIESEDDVVIAASAVLGNTYNLSGSAGALYLDVASAGSDFTVIDIEDTVSDWGDLYPVLLVKIANIQDVDPSIAT